jgi:hypothetical protein
VAEKKMKRSVSTATRARDASHWTFVMQRKKKKKEAHGREKGTWSLEKNSEAFSSSNRVLHFRPSVAGIWSATTQTQIKTRSHLRHAYPASERGLFARPCRNNSRWKTSLGPNRAASRRSRSTARRSDVISVIHGRWREGVPCASLFDDSAGSCRS